MSIELQPSQLRAIKSYVQSSSEILSIEEKIEEIELSTQGFTFQLNGILRANLQLVKNSKTLVECLDTCFAENRINQDLVVYRVCNYREMLKTFRDGRYIDYGYMSTSKNISDTQKFYQDPSFDYEPAFLTISIPTGSEVLDVDIIKDFDNNTYEGEILFKRQSLFSVNINTELPTTDLSEIMGRENILKFNSLRIIELNFERYL